MGELHLDIKVDILKRTFKVDANVGAPQVAYRETITQPSNRLHAQEADRRPRPVRATSRSSRSSRTSPARASSSKTASSAARCRRNSSRRRKGPQEVLGSGVLAGFPVVDVKVTLIDGSYHDVDSSALAFEIAARDGFREALRRASPVLLEPIMKVEVVTPEDYTGDVIGDLNSRRGQIQGMDMRGNANVVTRWCRSPTCSATSTTCAR
jgi:elongation factor G